MRDGSGACRPDLVAAAREAGDAGFDVLIACAFSYDAHSTEFAKLGRIPVLKVRMNADLHMAGELANTGQGNLFVVFGEPDVTLLDETGRPPQGQGERRGRLPPPDGRSAERRPRRHRAGSWTRTTTRRASSSATPTSRAGTTPTARSRRHSRRRSIRMRGRVCTVIRRGHSRGQSRGGWRSRSSITWGMR